jgi:hypothetical protein
MTPKSSPAPAHWHIPFHPAPDPAAVVCVPHACYTVLTPRLIRLASSPQGRFEDRAGQAFWHCCLGRRRSQGIAGSLPAARQAPERRPGPGRSGTTPVAHKQHNFITIGHTGV